jgi:hypothetical protein
MPTIIKTRLAASPIHGIGVYACENIPEGVLIWDFQPPFDQEFDAAGFARLDARTQAFIDEYGCFEEASGLWLLSTDNARYMNHSDRPNMRCTTRQGWASRDIAEGEEITCDYRECGDHAERFPFIQNSTDE